MKSLDERKSSAGFSLVELMVTMTILLIIMGIATSLFSRSLNTKSRESSKTDAQTAAQAALNVMSREIANSGYGLVGNGLAANSERQLLHFFSNVGNHNDTLTDAGENVTYFFEPTTQSILRHDANANGGAGETSIIINRISNVDFQYFDYAGANPVPVGPNNLPTTNTGRVRIVLTVVMEQVMNQVNPNAVVLTSDVTIRNADYMLRNY